MTYALDADVVIGALDSADPHHQSARRMFTAWHSHGDSLVISVINLSEVLIAPSTDPQRLRVARAAIAALGVEICLPTESIGVHAAELRGHHPISLPDAYALATARHLGATVASFDRKVLRAGKAAGIRTTSGRTTDR